MQKSIPEYSSGANIKQTYGVSSDSLRNWAKLGKIRFIKSAGGKHFYHNGDVRSIFHGTSDIQPAQKEKISIIYARVSSTAQRADLKRQADDLQAKYPTHKLITDIASGINFGRRGLTTILEGAHQGNIGQVVVAHKDRLCRFAFDLVRTTLERSGCQLVVLGKEDYCTTSESELADDMLAIANVFVAKRNGQRAAANRRKRVARAKAEEAQNNKRVKLDSILGKNAEDKSLSQQRRATGVAQVDGHGSLDL